MTMAGVSTEMCTPWQLDRMIKQEIIDEPGNLESEDEFNPKYSKTDKEVTSASETLHLKTEKQIKKEKRDICTGNITQIKQELSESSSDFPVKVYPCVQCSKSFPKPIRLAAHVRLCHARPFSCSKCNKSFYHKVSCDQHMKTHDPTEKPYKCNMCSRAFIMKIHLDEHLRTHFGNKPFSCNTCGKSFRTYVLCKQHMKVHEEGYECITCNVCFKKLRKASSLAAHLERHAQLQEHTCAECGKVFSAARLLTAHRRTHAKPFACNVCDRRFTARHALNKHLANHSDPKMLFCVHCCKAFSLQRSLTVHLRTHLKEFPFLCTSCGKGFCEEKEYEGHRSSTCCENHHLCATCGRSFKSPWGLARHAVVHKKSEVSSRKIERIKPEAEMQSNKSADKRLPSAVNLHNSKLPPNVRVCGHCYCVFTKAAAFTKHVLLHWQTSRSSCPSCLKRFCSRQILSLHYASHSKFHKCPHCSLIFTRIPQLTKHARTHVLIKSKLKRTTRLNCRKCGKLCNDYRRYVTHSRIFCGIPQVVNVLKHPKKPVQSV